MAPSCARAPIASVKSSDNGLKAERTRRHPTTGEPTRFGLSTIERWYYRALKEKPDSVGVLRRKGRTDAASSRR